MGRYRTYKRRANYGRHTKRGGNLGGSHLGDNVKIFMDNISGGLADDVSDKVTKNIFEKLGQMFSQAASTPMESRDEREDMDSSSTPFEEEEEETESSSQPTEEEGPNTPSEPTGEEGSNTPSQPTGEEGSNTPSQPTGEEGSNTPSQPTGEEGSNTPSQPTGEEGSNTPSQPTGEEGASSSPFAQEKVQPGATQEGNVPVAQGPVVDGEGNPIPQNGAVSEQNPLAPGEQKPIASGEQKPQVPPQMGGRRSNRRYMKYNVRRSQRYRRR